MNPFSYKAGIVILGLGAVLSGLFLFYQNRNNLNLSSSISSSFVSPLPDKYKVKVSPSLLVTKLVTPMVSLVPTNMSSPLVSPSVLVSPVMTPSLSPSPINTPPISASATIKPTPTTTQTPTPYMTPSLPPSLSPSPSPTLTLSPPATPTPITTPPSVFETPLVNVVISEIAWMGTGSTSTLSFDEWIELYNPNSVSVDITGWILKSLTGTNPDPKIILSGTILAHGWFLLERTDDTTIFDIIADQNYTGALNDMCETLELRDNMANLKDLISCSDSVWYSGNKDTRSSMERISSSQSGDISSNWGTNDGITKNGLGSTGGLINGTPKARNSVFLE